MSRTEYNLNVIRNAESILSKVKDSFSVLTKDELITLVTIYDGISVENTDPSCIDMQAWTNYRKNLFAKVMELGDYQEYFATLLD